jgi:hypothetical protein
MATSYAIDALDHFIREELPTTIDESLPEIAPIYKHIQATSLGVKRDKIGRDWQVEHLFSTGVAGLIQSTDVRGPLFDDNATYIQSLMLDPTSPGIDIFPPAASTPHTTSLKRVLTLSMSTGNFTVPTTWMSADALSATQIKKVAQDIKAVGQLRAITEAQSFFMSTDNALCQIDNYDNTNEASGYVTFTVKAGTGRTSFFRVGMMVDVYYDNSGTPNWGVTGGTHYANIATANTGAPYTTGYIPLIIADVDYIGGTITMASTNASSIAGAALTGDAPADDDWIVLANCGIVSGREMRTWGLEDWMASSGQIMGGSASSHALDLDTQSQFKSQVVTVSGPLTDTVMNGYVGGFLDAYPGQTLDTIITTMGVTLKYIEQPGLYNNRMFYDRTGKTLDVAGGWQDVTYNFNGRNFRWMISPMCISGKLYAIKMNNGNIKRYVPPKVAGTDTRIGSEIEFLAPLGGGSSIFKIAHASSGASQALLEAPFWEYHLVCPVDVKGVKLSSLTEATMS